MGPPFFSRRFVGTRPAFGLWLDLGCDRRRTRARPCFDWVQVETRAIVALKRQVLEVVDLVWVTCSVRCGLHRWRMGQRESDDAMTETEVTSWRLLTRGRRDQAATCNSSIYDYKLQHKQYHTTADVEAGLR